MRKKKFTTEKIMEVVNKYNLQIKDSPQFNLRQYYLPDQEIDYGVPPLFQIDPGQDWNKGAMIGIYDAYTIRLDGFQKQKIVYAGSRCIYDMEELEYIVSYMVMLYTKWNDVKKHFAEGWNLINIKKDFQ